jgi:hypothetical protein
MNNLSRRKGMAMLAFLTSMDELMMMPEHPLPFNHIFWETS